MEQKNKVLIAQITIITVFLLIILLPQLIGSNKTEKAVRRYDSTDELNDKSVTLGTVAGEILEAYSLKTCPKANIHYYNSYEEMLMALSCDKVDGVLFYSSNIFLIV